MAVNKYRNWLTVVWPKSDDDVDYCINQFRNMLIPGCCILHDEDGGKQHLQSYIQYDGPVTYKNVLADLKEHFGDRVNTCERAKTKHGALAYLVHPHDKVKHEYDPSEIIEFCGFDYVSELIKSEDPNKYDREIKRFIHENKILSYRLLSDIGTFVYPNWQRSIDNMPTKWVKYLISYEDEIRHGITNQWDFIIEENLRNDD